jgi:hypothetical protein
MQGIMAQVVQGRRIKCADRRCSCNGVSFVSSVLGYALLGVTSNQRKPRTVVKSGHYCTFTAPWFDTRVPIPLTIT